MKQIQVAKMLEMSQTGNTGIDYILGETDDPKRY